MIITTADYFLKTINQKFQYDKCIDDVISGSKMRINGTIVTDRFKQIFEGDTIRYEEKDYIYDKNYALEAWLTLGY